MQSKNRFLAKLFNPGKRNFQFKDFYLQKTYVFYLLPIEIDLVANKEKKRNTMPHPSRPYIIVGFFTVHVPQGVVQGRRKVKKVGGL